MHAIATEYADWLRTSNVPKLFLKAEPGAILANDRLVNLVRGWPAVTEKTVAGTPPGRKLTTSKPLRLCILSLLPGTMLRGVADLGQMRYHTGHRCAAVHTRRIVLCEHDSTVVAAFLTGMRKASLNAPFKPRHPLLSAMGFRAALPIAEWFFRHKHIYRLNSQFASERLQKLVARLGARRNRLSRRHQHRRISPQHRNCAGRGDSFADGAAESSATMRKSDSRAESMCEQPIRTRRSKR